MSKRNDFKHSLLAFGIRNNPGHLTRDRRKTAINAFVRIISPRFNQVRSVFDLKGRHLICFVNERLEEGIKVRTLQTEMGSIRKILRNAGMVHLCVDKNLSNRGLNIETPPGGRMGAFYPISNEQVLCTFEKPAAYRRPGVVLAMLLQRSIGLRAEEVVQSSESVLELWLQQLEESDERHLVQLDVHIDVFRGTKNARYRKVRMFYPDLVYAIVKAARERARANGGFLITSARTGDLLCLKKAVRSYSDLLRRWKIQSHAFRYAFACNQYREYRNIGFSHSDALAAVSGDLGHGDQRGDDMRRAYLLHRDTYKDHLQEIVPHVPNFVWNLAVGK